MKISATRAKLEDLKGDLLVLHLSKSELSSRKQKRYPGKITFKQLNDASGKTLAKNLKREEFSAAHLSHTLIRFPEWANFNAILLIGWENKDRSSLEAGEDYRRFGNIVYSAAKQTKSARVCLAGAACDFGETDALRALVQGLELSSYSFDKYKSKSKSKVHLKQIQIIQTRKLSQTDVKAAQAGAAGAMLARDLINMPACDCTPNYLVRTARKIGTAGKIKVQVYDKKRLVQMKAGALLSVTQGSDLPPYLIKMTYKPKVKAKKVVAIVGKGITFDTGGYSIKSASGMEKMKVDMSGAAAVLGAMQAVATVRPSVEVRAYVPTCENMINGRATRPGDIVKAMNGKSIEILNTDAEGRLILADALCLACRDEPDTIIDLATLTGACMVALGSEYAGLFSNRDTLAGSLSTTGQLEGERLWRLPLAAEYRKLIESPTADIKNTGGRLAGAITAALFLKEFVDEKIQWAHLDIAGPATSSGSGYLSNGGVGFGVRTLLRYIESL